jgi:cell wall-associated NlpC family hydrolase
MTGRLSTVTQAGRGKALADADGQVPAFAGMTAAKRAAIVAEVHEWIGTPYRHMGRIKRGASPAATV